MMRFALLCGLSFAPIALANEVVFYRCTDASGELTLQNMECPKGSKQEKKVMQGVGTVPMGAAAASTVAPSASTPAAPPTVRAPMPDPQPVPAPAPAPTAETGIADSKRLPPPVLFQCTTYDKDSYITENAEPQSRCVALRTVGLDGNPQTGAGEACEVVKDQCARVGDAALCDAWKKRLGETEVAWRFARAENTEKNKTEHERVQRIVSESSCGL